MGTRPLIIGFVFAAITLAGMGGFGNIAPVKLAPSRIHMAASRDLPHEAGLSFHSRNSIELLHVRCGEDSEELRERCLPCGWTLSGMLGWTGPALASNEALSAGEIMQRQLGDPLLCASRGPPFDL